MKKEVKQIMDKTETVPVVKKEEVSPIVKKEVPVVRKEVNPVPVKMEVPIVDKTDINKIEDINVNQSMVNKLWEKWIKKNDDEDIGRIEKVENYSDKRMIKPVVKKPKIRERIVPVKNLRVIKTPVMRIKKKIDKRLKSLEKARRIRERNLRKEKKIEKERLKNLAKARAVRKANLKNRRKKFK